MPNKKQPPNLRTSAMVSPRSGNLCKLGNSSQINQMRRLRSSGRLKSVSEAMASHIDIKGFNALWLSPFEEIKSQPFCLLSKMVLRIQKDVLSGRLSPDKVWSDLR